MPTYRSEVFNKNYSGTRLLTGFRQFDEACSGIPTGRLLIIFADTNVGKTKLALTLSRNFCFNKNPDGSSVKGTYFDLENGRAALWKDCVKVTKRNDYGRVSLQIDLKNTWFGHEDGGSRQTSTPNGVIEICND